MELSSLLLSAPVAAAMARARTSASSEEEIAEVALIASVEHDKVADFHKLVNATNVSENLDLIFCACERGNAEIVRLLIAHGASPSQPLPDLTTPLYVASSYNHKACAELLLQHKAAVNQPCQYGITPLLAACEANAAETAHVLLQGRADPNQARESGATPLYTAASRGYDKVVELLLRFGAKPDAPNVGAHCQGVTPLYAACRNGHSRVVRQLVELGCDPHTPLPIGQSPLQAAIGRRHQGAADAARAAVRLVGSSSSSNVAAATAAAVVATATAAAAASSSSSSSSSGRAREGPKVSKEKAEAAAAVVLQLRCAIEACKLDDLCEAINAAAGEEEDSLPAELLQRARHVRDALRAKARKSARKSRLKADAARQRDAAVSAASSVAGTTTVSSIGSPAASQSTSLSASPAVRGLAPADDADRDAVPGFELTPIEVAAEEDAAVASDLQAVASSTVAVVGDDDDGAIEEVHPELTLSEQASSSSIFVAPASSSGSAVVGVHVADEKLPSVAGFDDSAADEEQSQCVVCLDAPRSHLFVPCGHRCVCGPCAAVVLNDGNAECPMCRSHSTHTLRVFL